MQLKKEAKCCDIDLSPVIADGEEGEDTGGHAGVGHEVVELAVQCAVQPHPAVTL